MDQQVEQQLSVKSANFDAAYIEKALAQAYSSESLRVESFDSQAISQSGENFCSVIYRVKVAYRKSANAPLVHGSYIVKDLIPFMAELGSNEKLMFEQLLPAMDQVLAKATLQHDKKLSANCLFVERSKGKEIYLLEDLGALNYSSLNTLAFKGLSVEDARICLFKLAQFHASSMVLLQEQPTLAAKLAPSHYAKGVNDGFSQALVLDAVTFAAEIVKDFPGMSEIAEKMKAQIASEYSRRIIDVVDPKNCDFKVIAHGDIWLNNLMINRDTQNAVIVDFQNCFVGSPAVDLHFLFYTSLQLELLLNEQQSLLQYYLDSLCQTLKDCNYQGSFPTFPLLEQEMKRCLFYGYYAAVCELPICCASKEAASDFTAHTFANNEAMLAKRHQLYASERVRETLKATLPQFEEQGILEPL
ncbi:uncharacterized protein LOC117571011 [Drosophila albomicans]|uniref:Uncharacterized protein LOC117571011 n=1 Tax=Drosophila albomicans TaxID=7291 RepID=A0A6P8XBT3_DROAB|nr:uncharacterized protein LOC117571011 [Drosophila albomicans]